MAMIKCRECGKEISDRAEICPCCGAKTRYGIEISEQSRKNSYFFLNIVFLLAGGTMAYMGFTSIYDGMRYSYYYSYNPSFADIALLGIGVGLMATAILSFVKSIKRNQ